jgi:hypothetical protein
MSASDFSFGSEPVRQLQQPHFGGKAMFCGNDAINLLSAKPVQPSAKLLDNWFNGNTTSVRPKAADAARMMMTPM